MTPEPGRWARARGRVIRPLLKLGFRLRDRHRQVVSFSLYGAVAAVAYTVAFLLRFEFQWQEGQTVLWLMTLPLLLAVRIASIWLLRLSTSRWRFAATEDLIRLVASTSLGSLVFYLLTWYGGISTRVPRSVIAMEWVLTTYGIAGMWLAYRLLVQHARRKNLANGTPDKRVILVGAGEAAAMLVGEMRRIPLGYRPVGMVDDDPMKWGTTIHGVEVIGSLSDLAAIAQAEGAEELIIAIPSATPEQLNRIVDQCEVTELSFRLLPGIPEVLAGQARVHLLRPVRIEDLLGRAPVSLELPELALELQGRCVLVTGAAGSIGSELSWQIALNGPARLVLLDQAETPLVELSLELRERFPEMDLVPVVGDITHGHRMRQVFSRYRPFRVFHAAAYKHVPMMEENAEEAVRNNVLGTWIAARTAGETGAERFVLISSDKAVRPVNVMGATKRLAELVVMEAQERFPGTGFGAVRFGNVLGSSGSVIPIFQRQLEEGRPLTVTHPEMTRYFMTIPEAVQLVLQASLLPELRGQVAMLEMGEPVRILDLARRILRLSGSAGKVGRDIVFTGLRPGEKLHEVLVGPQEDAVPTGIPKVSFVRSREVCSRGVLEKLAEWSRAMGEDERDPMRGWFDSWLDLPEAEPGQTAAGRRGPWRAPTPGRAFPAPPA